MEFPSGPIAILGAQATYSCMETDVTFIGDMVLTCMDVGGTVAEWSPAVPVCQPGMIEHTFL